jgi:23S rRNA pseudouridine1911/1915/1917 synthase
VEGQAVRQASLKVGRGHVCRAGARRRPAEAVAQDIPLRVTYEDEALIVVDKPAGLVVHPAAGNLDGTLVNALLHHCRGQLSGIGGVARPGIVHRIDKDTSGLLVVAKSDAAHEGLARQFADHSIERAYKAITAGSPCRRRARSPGDRPLGPRSQEDGAGRGRAGKHAVTHYRTLAAMARRWSNAGSKPGEPTRSAFTLHQSAIRYWVILFMDVRLPDPPDSGPTRLCPTGAACGRTGVPSPDQRRTLHFTSSTPVDMQELIVELGGS